MIVNQRTFVKATPYDWPLEAPLCTSNTALLIIDMQRDFCEDGGYLTLQGYDVKDTRAIIPTIQSLLASCRGLNMSTYHTREGHRQDLSDLSGREFLRSRNNTSGVGIGDQGPLGRVLVRGEPGHDTISELYPCPGEPVIDKPGKGAFTNTDLDLLLRLKGIKNVIICGVTTDVCVHTTMREANDRGYECLLVEDACAASEEALHNSAIDMVHAEGGIFGATTKAHDILSTLEKMKPPVSTS